MAVRSVAEQQQAQQQCRNLAKVSAVRTKEHIRRLAEASKELSEKDYPAEGNVTLSLGILSLGLGVTLTFDSGEKIEFDGELWPIVPLTLGEGLGQAQFLVPPDKLMGYATVHVRCLGPNPAIGNAVIITWKGPTGLDLGTFVSLIDVTTTDTEKDGFGIFRKV